MVGEIRDGDTAETAINSALTGHLVFSTLHTNNAAGAIPRLIELKVNPKILSSALTLSIAQRLVRKLCEQCKKKATLDDQQKELVDQVVKSIQVKRPDIEIPTIAEICEPVGCLACNQTGYKGRVGVFEAVLMDQAVAALADKNPDEREIRLVAKPQGLLDMRQDGIVKVLHGITSLAELGRVVDLSAEII